MNLFRLAVSVGPTVLLVVYSQLILKWRIPMLGEAPADLVGEMVFYIRALLDPVIISSFAAAFIGAIIWFAAISRFPLSVAFPAYYGLTFVLVMVGSAYWLAEPLTSFRILGAALILLGLIVGSMD